MRLTRGSREVWWGVASRATSALHPVREAYDQHLGKVCHRHLSLCRGHVVLDPVRRERRLLGIQNRVGGARIAVTGLTDAAGIDDVAGRAQIDYVAVAQRMDF